MRIKNIKIAKEINQSNSEKIFSFLILLFCGVVFSNCGDQSDSSNNYKKKNQVVYYIDSKNGDDSNDGHSQDKPWQTLLRIDEVQLNPGDTIKFKRGSEFTGPLQINSSGNLQSYIVLTDYGDSQLSAPAFTNPVFKPEENNFGNCIRLKGSFILVENLYFHHTVAQLPQTAGGFTTMWELGAIYIDKDAQHCIVRSNELYDCGVGIKSYGQYAVIEKNYIHDCNRVLKEWGWGPIGIWLGADYQEVRYNRIFNYRAVDPRITWGPDSYGGGADGGAIEIDDARIPKSNISIHHNYTRDCQGFLEVTWTDVQQNPSYTNFKIHHNISDDYQQFVALWRGANFRIENNTIIRRKINVNDWGVFNITQHNAKNLIRNNIVVVEKDIVVFNVGNKGIAQPANIIENNLYYAASGELKMGYEEPGARAIFGNPLFINYQNSDEPNDFSILKESPAIDKGLDLGYQIDFINTKIPKGEVPDIGAFEYKPK